MKEAVQELIKNKQKMSLILTLLFFLGILLSAFMLYNLPGNLIYKSQVLDLAGKDRAMGQFIQLYLFIGLTFLLGVFALNSVIKSKKEIIVYVDRKEEKAETKKTAAEETLEEQHIDSSMYKDILNSQLSKEEIINNFLIKFAEMLKAGQGALYLAKGKQLQLASSYALSVAEEEKTVYEFGEGLIGQSAKESRTMYIDEIPDGYINIVSGLGTAPANYLLITPIITNNKVVGVIEIATFAALSKSEIKTAEAAASMLGDKIGKTK